MANPTNAAAAAAKPKAQLAKALRQKHNEDTPKFFAAGVVGILILFMIFHWIRFVYKRYESKSGRIVSLKTPVRLSRISRNFLLRRVPGFTSAGHTLIYLGYFATCIAISFVNIDWTSMIGLSKRLGWVAVSNLVLVTFLSLKNTPLALLTTYSYERLNILHQVAGYSTVFWVLLHAIVYIIAWTKSKNLHELLETSQVVGITAGFAFMIILGTSIFLRKLRYEIFYVVHIVMFMLILVLVGMHRPDFPKKTAIIVIFTASMWIADRAYRFVKISLFSIGNTAAITPLPHGGTRITLRKSPGGAVPGSHCFLWIPAVRIAETHPFTIVSTEPFELVIASYDGFTRDLYARALMQPGVKLKASVDGPYGVVPNFKAFTKVLFIAGGSGASFSLGVVIDLIRELGDSSNTTIEVIWAIKRQEMIKWFEKELQELQASPLVNLRIYFTSNSSASSLVTPMSGSSLNPVPLSDIEKTSLPSNDTPSPVSSTRSIEYDIEKNQERAGILPHRTLSLHSGRPDVAHLITSLVKAAEKHDRIAVAACGPDSLMKLTRKTVAGCIRPDGPSLELYCEEFGF